MRFHVCCGLEIVPQTSATFGCKERLLGKGREGEGGSPRVARPGGRRGSERGGPSVSPSRLHEQQSSSTAPIASASCSVNGRSVPCHGSNGARRGARDARHLLPAHGKGSLCCHAGGAPKAGEKRHQERAGMAGHARSNANHARAGRKIQATAKPKEFRGFSSAAPPGSVTWSAFYG